MKPETKENGKIRFSTQSIFHFKCHSSLPCFTQCCRDVNIFLTPYDLLRLRQALKLSSGEFLRKHTIHYLAGAGQIPVVQLAMDPETLYCKLVTDEGCSVYEDRPWACRMYPLDLVMREGEYTLIIGKERCLGLLEKSSMPVNEWLDGQGVQPYVLMEQAFQSVMPPGYDPAKAGSAGIGKILFLAYDLDRFAGLLQDSKVRSFYEIDDELLRRVEEDKELLLRLAFQYIRNQLEELLEHP
ncbi:MAG: YkgJ family cysteine cluster protein [Deltaproteobacteria bacterium]|nr:YkgJ family cysteine cluster protein [Deltaproteobacteria bacterium]